MRSPRGCGHAWKSACARLCGCARTGVHTHAAHACTHMACTNTSVHTCIMHAHVRAHIMHTHAHIMHAHACAHTHTHSHPLKPTTAPCPHGVSPSLTPWGTDTPPRRCHPAPRPRHGTGARARGAGTQRDTAWRVLSNTETYTWHRLGRGSVGRRRVAQAARGSSRAKGPRVDVAQSTSPPRWWPAGMGTGTRGGWHRRGVSPPGRAAASAAKRRGRRGRRHGAEGAAGSPSPRPQSFRVASETPWASSSARTLSR